jgi:nitrous oxide reductase
VGVTVRVDAMSENTLTRRRTLQVAGTAGATALGGALVTSVSAQSGGWTEVDSPVSKTLYGVVNTQAGPFAAGKTGNVLGRVDGSWRVVVDDGPQTRSNSLRTLAVTDDGKRIWFAGSSGALGAYDVVEGVQVQLQRPEREDQYLGGDHPHRRPRRGDDLRLERVRRGVEGDDRRRRLCQLGGGSKAR